MTKPDFTPLKLFITGPTYIRDEAKAAGELPEFGHRDSENVKRMAPIMENLRRVALVDDSYQPMLINGSGSTAMEAAVRSLVADGETMLNVTVGAFGDLFGRIASANGKQCEQLRFDYGRAIDPDVLRKTLERVRPAVVTFTHNETSTGVTNDIVAVCSLIREFGAMPVVDGVSIFGGTDLKIMEAQPAMYVTATQKSLALPAGFGIALVGREAEEKAARVANRGYSSCILNQLAKARINQTLTTPNTQLVNQLWAQLDYIVNEEGVENRFARHAAMRAQTAEWVSSMDGFDLFAQDGHRSPTLTTVQCPQGLTVEQLKKGVKESMRARGYLFDPGYGKVNAEMEKAGKRVIFRIGHMGDITPAMLAEYLEELGEVLKAL